MTTVAHLANLLQQAMGLCPDSVGLPIVESALKTRLSAGSFKDLHEYFDHVLASSSEMQELIDSVTVPETWFFRDREAFAGLAEEARDEWLRLQPRGPLRLLSLPCASGEEPYSMAMALLEAGFTASQFRIDGIDISVRTLERARKAIYGRNSFRGKELEFRDRFFKPAGSEFILAEDVRAQVQFRHGNLLDPGFMANAPPYDFIFCRNLLIYFSVATQDRTVEILKRLLKIDGTLFVGPSESGLFLNHDFVSAKLPRAFAFRNKSCAALVPDATVTPVRERKRALAAATAVHLAAKPAARRAAVSRPAVMATSPAASTPTIDEIAALANRGSLSEAIQRADVFLGVHGPSAQVYQLVGLAHDASGMPQQAEQYYRKVLYLEPAHHEALIHLAVLLEKKGDAAGAQRLYLRANRGIRGGPS